jgi:hypothetical protein
VRTKEQLKLAVREYHLSLVAEGFSPSAAKNKALYSYGGSEHLPQHQYQDFWDGL